MTEAPAPTKPAPGPGFRMAVDFGPLVVFFLVNSFAGGAQLSRILAATAAFMVAMAIAMIVSRVRAGHISPMLWISGGLVLVFGALTLYFQNETFIKIKPTIVYLMFAVILGYGLISRRPLLQMLLETAYPGLTPRGWHLLTINWTIFFVVMAAINEGVWRTQTTDFWVAFKLWGVVPLTFLFAMLNVPMLMKHGLAAEKPVDAPLPPEG